MIDSVTRGQALSAMETAAIKVATSGCESAKLCHRDAVMCFARRDFKSAHARALRSLSHSVGIFHSSYKKAAAL